MRSGKADAMVVVNADAISYGIADAYYKVGIVNQEGFRFFTVDEKELKLNLYCQTAHCGRYIPHFDFSAKPSPIVPYRHLPQSLSGMTADCRSLV